MTLYKVDLFLKDKISFCTSNKHVTLNLHVTTTEVISVFLGEKGGILVTFNKGIKMQTIYLSAKFCSSAQNLNMSDQKKQGRTEHFRRENINI